MKVFKPLSNLILHLFKGVGVYIFFNIIYISYLFFGELAWLKFYDTLFFYFNSPYTDFKIWFPNFYLVVYLSVIGIKMLILILLLFILFLIYKFYLRHKVIYRDYMHFIAHEGGILMFYLIYYLSLYFLSRSIFEKPIHGDLQILIARGFLIQMCCQGIIVIFSNYRRIIGYLKNYLFYPQLPYNISILRILFFLYLIWIYLAKYQIILPTISLQNKAPLPYVAMMVRLIPVNVNLYTAFVILGIVCCLFIAIGYKTRWFLLLNAICCFYIIATPNFFGKLWHEQLVIWISWFFTFSRCYDVFSVDAKLAGTPIVKSADYTFPVRFVWLQFGVIYFWAGFYKLWDCGFDWALGKSMVNQVQLEWLQHYDTMPAIRIDHYPILLYVGGIGVILFELVYPLLILRTNLRWVAAVLGLVIHNIIGYFMYISFLFFLQVFYVFYFDFNKFFTRQAPFSKKALGYSRPAFFLGVVILTLNFLCGMFSIDSYPFSAYPRYAALIPDSIKTIYFEVNQVNDYSPNVHEIGKGNDFPWENYGWVENGLINDFNAGHDVRDRVGAYWKVWQAYNPELLQYDSVRVYIAERPVSPEGIGKEKLIDYICTLPKE
jgi:hypothetical protein